MATRRLPSLGDESNKLQRVRFLKPLPEGRPALIKAFADILNEGNVQKIVVETGREIVYEKLMPSDGTVEDLEKIEADDIFGAIRNNDIIDFKHLGKSPFETFFNAFSYLAQRDLVAKGIAVHDWLVLRRWLGADNEDAPIDVYGVPVYRHVEIPDDVLAFVAAHKHEPDVVALTLRITMDEET